MSRLLPDLVVSFFGLCIGSFLNVVIARVPRGESIVRPRSRCPGCREPIAGYDNIPVISWLILRGRCRRCGQPISPRYPLVEIVCAVLVFAVWRRLGPTAAFLGYAAFASTLLALAFIDLDTWLLPHQMTWPLLALGLVSPAWNPDLGWMDAAIGAAAGFAAFALVALVGEKLLKKETMGWGDVWLLSGIGAWLGWQALLPVVVLSSVQGAMVGVLLLALRRPADQRPVPADVQDADWVPPRHAVPFGPFLALAALEVLFLGERLAEWYFQVIGKLVQ
ncbi:MAG TPA: prepilin peptidase [Myxococcales bacterium]|nr:prepilin peptidase [Myxococcales bacterium]